MYVYIHTYTRIYIQLLYIHTHIHRYIYTQIHVKNKILLGLDFVKEAGISRPVVCKAGIHSLVYGRRSDAIRGTLIGCSQALLPSPLPRTHVHTLYPSTGIFAVS